TAEPRTIVPAAVLIGRPTAIRSPSPAGPAEPGSRLAEPITSPRRSVAAAEPRVARQAGNADAAATSRTSPSHDASRNGATDQPGPSSLRLARRRSSGEETASQPATNPIAPAGTATIAPSTTPAATTAPGEAPSARSSPSPSSR